VNARISDIGDLTARVRALQGPGVKSAVPSAKRRWKNHASVRLGTTLANEKSGRGTAAELFDSDESALRRALNGGESGLSLAWILEAMLERRPDLLRIYLLSLLEDLERLKPTGSDK
jgi:hypothetical protein